MDIKDKQKEFMNYAKSQKGAKVYYREDWDVEYFSLLGKCFGMMNGEIITLKGYPEENDILRQRYKSVIPGYYTNKNHWNSIYLEAEELSIEEIKHLINISYKLVYEKLTKKAQKQIDEEYLRANEN